MRKRGNYKLKKIAITICNIKCKIGDKVHTKCKVGDIANCIAKYGKLLTLTAE